MKDIPNNNLENDQPSRKRVKLHSPGEEFAENGSNNGIQAHLNNDKVIHKVSDLLQGRKHYYLHS